jgi:hypothetical protein
VTTNTEKINNEHNVNKEEEEVKKERQNNVVAPARTIS